MFHKQAMLSGVLLCGAAVLAGCGMGTVDHTTGGTLFLQGRVHGGQQAVTGSTVQLYTVGKGGNGSAATPMLTQSVVSDNKGNFTITGDYTCGDSSTGTALNSPSNQVYIVATGGNPGLPSGTNNKALTMVAALGACANLPGASYVLINEVTTVAAAWALAPFMTSATQVGATATNVSGIENAFLNAGLLADTTTGYAPTALPTNLTVETGKLYALADAIASCVNSDGTAGCNALFAAATEGSVPKDTLTATLNIVKNPGQHVMDVYNAMGTQPPFPTTLAQAPNDWTMSLAVTGGGLTLPTAIGVDAQGVVWVANESSPLSSFSPQGTPMSATGYGLGKFGSSYGLTIDSLGDIWVSNYNTSYNTPGAVTKFMGTGSATPGAVVYSGSNPGFYDSSLYYPYAVSADTNGNIFIANNGNSSATIYTSAGVVYQDPDGNPSTDFGKYLGIDAYPPAIAVDSSHGFWLPDGSYSVAHITANGALIKNSACCDGSYGVATDSFGNAWVASYYDNAFGEVTPSGTVSIASSTVGGLGGLSRPEFLAIDAAQNVWFANYSVTGSISEVAGNGGPQQAGTAISPTVGVHQTGGYGLDAGMREPIGIVPDRSGNVWVSTEGAAKVFMFFGLATPTVTPVQPVPTAP